MWKDNFLPVFTWYLRASLQSVRSWSKFWGSSGRVKSMTCISWSGWWKSKTFSSRSFVLSTNSMSKADNLCRNSCVSLFPCGFHGSKSKKKKKLLKNLPQPAVINYYRSSSSIVSTTLSSFISPPVYLIRWSRKLNRGWGQSIHSWKIELSALLVS